MRRRQLWMRFWPWCRSRHVAGNKSAKYDRCRSKNARTNTVLRLTAATVHPQNPAPSKRHSLRLRECLAISYADGVQQTIYDLNPMNNVWSAVPDELVEGLLARCWCNRMIARTNVPVDRQRVRPPALGTCASRANPLSIHRICRWFDECS